MAGLDHIKLKCPIEGCEDEFIVPLEVTPSVVREPLVGVNLHVSVPGNGMDEILKHVVEHVDNE